MLKPLIEYIPPPRPGSKRRGLTKQDQPSTPPMATDARTKTAVNLLDGPSAQARKKELELLLAATRGDPARAAERASLRAEDAAVAARLAELRDAAKRENTRRNFAGIGSPIHEAIVARLDAKLVTEIEEDALARFTERERRSAERRAKKTDVAAADKSSPPADQEADEPQNDPRQLDWVDPSRDLPPLAIKNSATGLLDVPVPTSDPHLPPQPTARGTGRTPFGGPGRFTRHTTFV